MQQREAVLDWGWQVFVHGVGAGGGDAAAIGQFDAMSAAAVMQDARNRRVAFNHPATRLNRADKRNCMSPTLNRRMLEVIESIEFRDDVGVLVLSGEGTAWSAGMDLKEYFRETEADGLKGTRKAQRESYGWWRRLRWYQKPTIAMVNGWCFGGAFSPDDAQGA